MDYTGISLNYFSMAKGGKGKQVITRFRGPKFRPTFIRQWRKSKDLTLERLAARVEMSPSNLSNIEKGIQGYTQENLEALSDALGCEVVDLLIRNPADPEGIWSLWERAKPAEREQIVNVVRALVKAA